MAQFKAFIRVVKSLGEGGNSYFGLSPENVVREPLIEAENKEEVKKYLLNKYPQFFPTNKVYEKESKKDNTQFFYVVIFPLYNWEAKEIEEGEWKCDYCGQMHENKYVSSPRTNTRLFPDKLFCRSEDDVCYNAFKADFYKDIEMLDDLYYINKNSLNYIYKITEKATGKCYIGKTKNEPFFRWWNHLKRNSSPFGNYFRSTPLSNWTFEVLEILPSNVDNKEILRIESNYILKFNSIDNGFNTVISNKEVYLIEDEENNNNNN